MRIPDIKTPITIADLVLPNRVFLAPMSGVTDLPFRELAHEAGAGLVVSEMVASAALVTGHEEMKLKALRGRVPLHAVQIAGCETGWMGLAARLAQDNGANLIDINMGCPARRVTTGYSGSALMRDLDHAYRLIEAVVESVNVPVTLKMRLGWDHESINAPELAARAQSLGVQMITVHGRTRCQFYKGNADWCAVRAVRNATTLPLVVNGDIHTCADIDNALGKSGADAVMIGRASYGAPWLAGQLAHGLEQIQVLEAFGDLAGLITIHYENLLSHHGLVMGVRQARKHLSWYLEKHASDSDSALRREIMVEKNSDVVLKKIEQIFGEPGEFSSSQMEAA